MPQGSIATIGLAAFLAASTVDAQTPPESVKQAAAQDIERRLDWLEFQVKSLQGRVAYRSATLDCNSGRYTEFLFTTGVLAFFAACTKIEPYLEGHRIQVNIGNPHAFNFRNVTGTLSYGKDLLDAIRKKVDVSITETVRAGSWNTITIIVNPSKAEEMRYLELELNAEMAGALR